VFALYLSILLPILRGLARSIYLDFEFFVILFSQGVVFLGPLAILFCVRLNTIRSLLIISLFLYVFIVQLVAEYFVVSEFFLGIKNLFGALVYIPIVHHLIKNYDCFNFKIEKHIRVIFILAISIAGFELISALIPNSFDSTFTSLAYNDVLRNSEGRPLGIMLNVHYQGIILAMASIYYYVNRIYSLSLIAIVVLVLANIKTWTVALLLVIVFYFFKNLFKPKISEIFIVCISILALPVLVFAVFSGVVDHYSAAFSSSSYAINLMKDLWFSLFSVMEETLIPIGFFSQGQEAINAYSKYMKYTDAYFIFNLYQVGVIGMLLYSFVLFYTLMKRHKYSSITLLSVFSIVHTNPIVVPGILIIVTYFGYYYIFENSDTRTLLRGSK
jgi:hypothetical protein